MAMIMTLEGPQIGGLSDGPRLAGLRGQLYGTGLGFTSVVMTNPLIVAGGFLLGMWLAGSASGQKIVKRYTKRGAR